MIHAWRRWWPRPEQRRVAAGVALLTLALAIGFAASLAFGAVSVPWREIPAAFAADHPNHLLIVDLRLARVVACCLVGAAFAVAGTLLQTVVRNPLADAGLLGINAGAGLAVIAAVVLWPEQGLALPVLAFLGALFAVLLLTLAAWASGGTLSPLKILLSGVAVQALLYAAIAVLSFLFADRTPAFIGFTVGSLQGVTWPKVAPVAPLVALALVGAWTLRRPLDLLLLDDASALSAGLAVGRARLGIALLAALLAACAVALAGLVGFVGLLVPNSLRLVIGPAHVRLLPLSALAGACLMVYADLAARRLWIPIELPVGALLALLGGPYFLFVLWRKLP